MTGYECIGIIMATAVREDRQQVKSIVSPQDMTIAIQSNPFIPHTNV